MIEFSEYPLKTFIRLFAFRLQKIIDIAILRQFFRHNMRSLQLYFFPRRDADFRNLSTQKTPWKRYSELRFYFLFMQHRLVRFLLFFRHALIIVLMLQFSKILIIALNVVFVWLLTLPFLYSFRLLFNKSKARPLPSKSVSLKEFLFPSIFKTENYAKKVEIIFLKQK